MSQSISIDNQFAKDIKTGLEASPKKLSSKYFYDAKGDELFQAIMAMPEYYLTNCEQEIFETQSAAISQAFGDEPLDIIELGAGDGSKTKVLLKQLLTEGKSLRYIPSDISENILSELQLNFKKELPYLEVLPLAGDYFSSLKNLPNSSGRKRVMLYLGSNIGNLEKDAAVEFLAHLKQFLNSGDLFLCGIDLKKDPQIILDAYNDAAGITAAFNLNLLRRINRELGGNFDLQEFKHWERYDPHTGEARSYIVSKKAQSVTISALKRSFDFEAWESIRVELSQKYSQKEIDTLAIAAGYQPKQTFIDQRNYYVDALWKV